MTMVPECNFYASNFCTTHYIVQKIRVINCYKMYFTVYCTIQHSAAKLIFGVLVGALSDVNKCNIDMYSTISCIG